MREIGSDLVAYFKAIFIETSPIVFTLLDIVSLVFFIFPSLAQGVQSDESLTRIVAGALFLVSFSLGNFSLYRKLAQDIPYRADIRFKLTEQEFTHPYGSGFVPFEEFRNTTWGFSNQGVPCWCMLWAHLEGSNRGMEEGRLDFEVVKTRLPALFSGNRVRCDFTPISVVDGRSHARLDINIFAVVAKTDPEDFARTIRELFRSKETYEAVVRYKTIWVDGESKEEQIIIKGDFKGFYQKMVQHWNDHGLLALADAARIN